MEAATILIAVVLIIVVAALWSRRTQMATPLVVLVIGIGIGLIPGLPAFHLQPEWVLAGVLPPLLYASSVRVPVIDLRRNLGSITWLSVVLVIASALTVGALVHLMMPRIPLAAGIAFGAVVSPTDAVAATSIGKRLGLPNRIMVVLEAESLFNDATALVVMRTAVVALAGSFSLGDAVWEFVTSVVIAVVLGYLVGVITVWWRARLNDPVLNTTVSFVVPFLAYVPADALGASGVVAVVVAGVVTGHRGAQQFSARERAAEQTNWATLQFLIENGLFLAMGLELHTLLVDLPGHGSMAQVLHLVLMALGVLLVLRAAFVAMQVFVVGRRRQDIDDRRSSVDEAAQRIKDPDPDDPAAARRSRWARRRVERGRADLDFEEREPLTARGGAALTWAGMRGVLTLAAALSLPEDVPYRTLLITAAFGVALVSLLFYGPTLPLVIRWLRIPPDDPAEEQTELHQLMRQLARAGVSAVDPATFTVDGDPVDPDLVKQIEERYQKLRDAPFSKATASNVTRRQQAAAVQRAYVSAMRDELRSEQAIGSFSTAVLKRAESLLDAQELRLDP